MQSNNAYLFSFFHPTSILLHLSNLGKALNISRRKFFFGFFNFLSCLCCWVYFLIFSFLLLRYSLSNLFFISICPIDFQCITVSALLFLFYIPLHLLATLSYVIFSYPPQRRHLLFLFGRGDIFNSIGYDAFLLECYEIRFCFSFQVSFE